jgi:uncharacterized lipoprotein YddW (UPF0748 family)
MKHTLYLLFLCCTIIAKAQFPQQVKGVWLTNVASKVLNSRANIKEAVEQCKKSGINTIFVCVWNKGLTMYKSKVMLKEFGVEIDPIYKDRDPLQELIEEAAKQKIAVHAWFEFGFATSYEKFGEHIIKKHPEWKAIDAKGNYVVKNKFYWMNAFDKNVQQFIKNLVLEVVQNYKIQGVQGDDRLPALPSIAGYDTATINMYKQEHNGAIPPINHKDSAWVQWRANKLTSFLADLYQSVKAINKKVFVTTAPNIHPWAKDEYLQDWPTWVKKGITDGVFVQLYRYNLDAYKKVLNNMAQQAGKYKNKVVPGILLSLGDGYIANEIFLQQTIEANRKAGFKGEVFFYYEGIKKMESFFTTKYKTF